jgi:hypothetical protein
LEAKYEKGSKKMKGGRALKEKYIGNVKNVHLKGRIKAKRAKRPKGCVGT